ncbi:TrmH family RNA methyltransferase [Dysgonomonadaceae bacterium PH5-43]|nr:TrmH family RNA methyltransferase [Dysgonomonadaceae bacterium PH5-43]
MISKNKIKFIKSLEKKKNRQELRLFLAEGNKLVEDILPYFSCELLIAKPSWIDTHNVKAKEMIVAETGDIEKVSLLKTPQDVVAVFAWSDKELNNTELQNDLTLLLEDIQDPGNLGTIIRIADWFGIKNIICSRDSVDVYNPKVVQATMGAIARVNVFYSSLQAVIEENKDLPVYGTFLDGEDIYKEEVSSTGFIVMGNEGNGISKSLESYINKRLFVPNYPPGTTSSESLNVAVATAVVCAEFRRRQIYSV